MAEKNARCVVIAAGEILCYDSVKAMLQPDDFIVCADGGLSHCAALGVRPKLLIGDMDSVRSNTDIPDGTERILFPAEKNYTDTQLALEHVRALGYRDILLCGALGGRLDHTLANLQSLCDCALHGAVCVATDGRTTAQALYQGEMVLKRRPDCYFSLLCAGETAEGVYIRGAKYALDNHTLHFHSPRAISNEFLDGDAVISVKSGMLLVLCVPKDDPANQSDE